MKDKIYLGGSISTKWREKLIPLLKLQYFDPKTEDCDEVSKAIEDIEKRDKCNIHLYVITSGDIDIPKNIAEATESTFNQEKSTIFAIIPQDIEKKALESLKKAAAIIIRNGGFTLIENDIKKIANILNLL